LKIRNWVPLTVQCPAGQFSLVTIMPMVLWRIVAWPLPFHDPRGGAYSPTMADIASRVPG
jgi:hypothetical protein